MDSSAADSLSQTVQLFQNLDMRYQVNIAGVKEQDLITQDLLHKLELESLDAVEMVKLAELIGKLRKIDKVQHNRRYYPRVL